MKNLTNSIVIILLVTFSLVPSTLIFSQNVSINNTGASANSNAILDVDDSNNDKGILIPRITTNQRVAISGLGSSEEGLTVYDQTTNTFWLWDGAQWNEFIIEPADGAIDVDNVVVETVTFTGLGANSATLQAITPATGMMIYVSTTNSTFTSTGFWGYDGSAWVAFQTGESSASSPTVTTTAASSIAETSATSGGNVTSDGGATVTAYGVCWDTSSNPTTSNSTTSDGSGTGSFSSSITGLSAGTTYYVRAYATNSEGTSYGSEESFTTSSAPVAVGDSYQGGIVFYILQSGDAGYDANVQHGLIVSVFEINSSNKDTEYGCKNTLNNTGSAIGTGAANTAAILATCSTSGIAAELCDDYSVIEGSVTYDDWYLPSELEMVELYNASTYGSGSLTLSTNFNSIEYYTSTEASAEKAYHLHFNGYNMHSDKKDKTKNVRAIRDF